MKPSEFVYQLPPQLIAQHPAKDRTSARLLVLERQSGKITQSRFDRLHEFLRPGDLLVLNDTRVMKCRLLGQRPGGGSAELLLVKRIGESLFEAIGKPLRRLRPGGSIEFANGRLVARIVDKRGGKLTVSLEASGDAPLVELIEQIGQVPLPPYIKRASGPSKEDEAFYQTVYSRKPGAVAAPTAGLHFDAEYLESLRSLGIRTCFITAHTGLGSFMPIRCERVQDHTMPAEEITIGQDAARAINQTRAEGNRVIAVGTSTVRALESAAAKDGVEAKVGPTDLFITPGFEFKVTDALITNFHQPASPLIVLVCAFAGREKILKAYEVAVRERYRFLSFGDAMLIT